jgi:hypothetical protein
MPETHENTTIQHRAAMYIGQLKDKRHYCAIVSHVFLNLYSTNVIFRNIFSSIRNTVSIYHRNHARYASHNRLFNERHVFAADYSASLARTLQSLVLLF